MKKSELLVLLLIPSIIMFAMIGLAYSSKQSLNNFDMERDALPPVTTYISKIKNDNGELTQENMAIVATNMYNILVKLINTTHNDTSVFYSFYKFSAALAIGWFFIVIAVWRSINKRNSNKKLKRDY